MNRDLYLKCSRCPGILRLDHSRMGCDKDSVAGADSGFNVEVALCCDKCGAHYLIGFVRASEDFMPVIDDMKVVE